MRILEGGLFFEGRVFIAEALEFSFQVFAGRAFSGSYLFALTLSVQRRLRPPAHSAHWRALLRHLKWHFGRLVFFSFAQIPLSLRQFSAPPRMIATPIS